MSVIKDAEISAIFNRYDANGDGLISLDELRHLMTTLSSSNSNPTKNNSDKEIIRIMEEIDNNKDGFIDFKEFLVFHKSQASTGSSSNEELRAAFEMYDKDKNGVISVRELHAVMKKLGEKVTVKDCGKMIKSVDVDGDGCVNFEEFKKMMRSS